MASFIQHKLVSCDVMLDVNRTIICFGKIAIVNSEPTCYCGGDCFEPLLWTLYKRDLQCMALFTNPIFLCSGKLLTNSVLSPHPSGLKV